MKICVYGAGAVGGHIAEPVSSWAQVSVIEARRAARRDPSTGSSRNS